MKNSQFRNFNSLIEKNVVFHKSLQKVTFFLSLCKSHFKKFREIKAKSDVKTFLLWQKTWTFFFFLQKWKIIISICSNHCDKSHFSHYVWSFMKLLPSRFYDSSNALATISTFFLIISYRLVTLLTGESLHITYFLLFKVHVLREGLIFM